MKRFHVVLNAFSDDIEKQISEICGLTEYLLEDVKKGNTFIVGDGKMDEDDKHRLAEMAPTKSVIFVILKNLHTEMILDCLMETMCFGDVYLFGSSSFGQEMAIRLGKRSDGSSATGCQWAALSESIVYVKKQVYSNHMMATFCMENSPFCISAARGLEGAMPKAGKSEKEIKTIDKTKDQYPANLTNTIFEEKKPSGGLQTASFVLVGGRGVKNKAGADALARAAEGIHAEFGASRPVVMNAWAAMDKLIGVSGSMIHPKVCITAGVSGAAALYAGIEKSGFIIAINRDENAPIMRKADVVIVDDCQEVLRALQICMEKERADETQAD
ncbi:MAG: FAD-binding protein [Hespellia sp.]|nr:FAD-binding protein [Hespellia sp.]